MANTSLSLPEPMDVDSPDSLGSQMVKTLVERLRDFEWRAELLGFEGMFYLEKKFSW